MTVEEVCLNGIQVEPPTRFVHQRRQTCRRIVSAALADPLDGLFQADLQLNVHAASCPIGGVRRSASPRATEYSRSTRPRQGAPSRSPGLVRSRLRCYPDAQMAEPEGSLERTYRPAGSRRMLPTLAAFLVLVFCAPAAHA